MSQISTFSGIEKLQNIKANISKESEFPLNKLMKLLFFTFSSVYNPIIPTNHSHDSACLCSEWAKQHSSFMTEHPTIISSGANTVPLYPLLFLPPMMKDELKLATDYY